MLTHIVQGRLTLETAVPVSTTDQTAKGTLYYTPYNGRLISLYDGTRWRLYSTAEISLALTLTSGKNYDVFAYDNAGTITLELSAAWTNDTTRADALTTQDGVYVKSGATTRRWLGTIRASGTNTTEDSDLKRYVANVYNRQPRRLRRIDTTDSWTYTTAAWRAWDNDTTNNRVDFILPAADYFVELEFNELFIGTGATPSIAIGVDSHTTPSGLYPAGMTSGSSYADSIVAVYSGYPGLGYHYLGLMEWGQTSGVFFGDWGKSNVQCGAEGKVWI